MVIEAYTRKSRALGDPDDPELLAHHVAQLRRLAAEDGVSLPESSIALEIGSGDTIADRPVFRRLLEQWERLPPGTGGVVYVVELSRLSRGSLAERGRVFDALARAGLRIRTPGRVYDLSDPDDELLFAFFSAIDRHELGRYRRRVKEKKDEMTRNGKLTTGGDRYGYRWDKNTQSLLPYEPEFSIVAALYRDSLHMSDLQLSKRYGLRPDQISDILRNPIYCGYPHRHTRGTKTGTRWLPRAEWFLAEKPGDWPAVCTPEQWEAVQQARQRRYRERAKPGTAEGWCRDILVLIDDSGGEYRPHLSAQTLRHGCRVLTYFARGEEYSLHFPRALVHAAVYNALQGLFSDPEFLLQAATEHETRRKAEAVSRASGAVLDGIPERLVILRRELDALLLEQIRAETPEDRASIARVRQQHEQEIEWLKRQQSRHEQEQATNVNLEWLLPLLPALAAAFPAEWEAADDADRRALVSVLIARVPARVLRAEPGRPYRREVGAVEWADWLKQ